MNKNRVLDDDYIKFAKELSEFLNTRISSGLDINVVENALINAVLSIVASSSNNFDSLMKYLETKRPVFDLMQNKAKRLMKDCEDLIERGYGEV